MNNNNSNNQPQPPKTDYEWVGGQKIYGQQDDEQEHSSTEEDDLLNQDYGFDDFRKPGSRTIED